MTFRRNSATQYGAAIYSFDNSQVIFTGNVTASFNNNAVSSNAHLQHGGTILSENNGHISFEENSIAVFTSNSAGFGAAILSISNSSVIFKDNSSVIFIDNIAYYCGVLTSLLLSNITFADNTQAIFSTNIIFSNYKSSSDTIYSKISVIIFLERSLVTFINNKADRGGAVAIFGSSGIIKGYSKIIVNNNFAVYSGGALNVPKIAMLQLKVILM